jgi:23S rRNA (guanine1835-N2)-methyltransferase
VEQMHVAQGTFNLARYPERINMRAWDSADEYLLDEIHELDLDLTQRRIVVVNDSHGALTCALSGYETFSWSDSILAEDATRRNLEANGVDPADITQLASTDPLPDDIGVVLIKIPKTLALLKYQLHLLRPKLRSDVRLIGAGMVKHIHSSTLNLFEGAFGPTVTSLAKKKARVIRSELDTSLVAEPVVPPTIYEIGDDIEVVTMPGVFAQSQVDVGTRLLLKNLPEVTDGMEIIDLGCGNGAVGVSLARSNPSCLVSYVDSSHLAVASAQATVSRAMGDGRNDEFFVGDSLTLYDDASVDLIVCNPPFHDQHATDDSVAWQMFNDAKRVLRPGGQLLVVGNRHLGYHAKLKQLFGNLTNVASNKKFVVLSATRH